jgi:hypothetical protein
LDSIYLCPCIGPVPTTATKVPSSTARALLPVASGSYGLLCTSGFHRPLGLCEGRQSRRQPNGSQSATSNCNTHDPVTRGLHRQHLVQPQFVRGLDVEQSRLRVLEPFFRKWGRGGRGPGASPGVPNPPPGPPRRLAAQGGKGEPDTARTHGIIAIGSMLLVLRGGDAIIAIGSWHGSCSWQPSPEPRAQSPEPRAQAQRPGVRRGAIRNTAGAAAAAAAAGMGGGVGGRVRAGA